ncbi:MAG: 16S rRNA (uracil(1498)-N(3))-methyltransferase [Pseudolabrys sp.]|nr:16S rRNA (uracil(1498)-N(3))-methyltransferase [Pseudolabrys sp.]
MAPYDFRAPRLFVEDRLKAGTVIELDRDAANYLRNALRLKDGDAILLFNGRDGEWRCLLSASGKRALTATAEEQTRPQTVATDLHYLFAPLKHARLDYVVQKAVELGVSKLQPVITQHTQVARVNVERMRANVIEAAQQCGVISIPEVAEPTELKPLLAKLDADRLLVFCDEEAEIADPVAALAERRPQPSALVPAGTAPEAMPLAVLIGPEGGFSADEREALLKIPNVARIALGPRILRADTAAVAALALVQAVLGDWVSGDAAL